VKAHLAYLWYVLRHKWFVFLECWRLGIPWLGVVHDVSKFTPGEWFPYVNHFHGPNSHHKDGSHAPKQIRDETGYYKPTNTGDVAFDFAWLLHQKRNKHHWQWWVLPEDEGGLVALPIPPRYRLEMLADWRGAGRAQGTPDTKAWYLKHRDKMKLDLLTREWIEVQLGVAVYLG
jgi:hypothetical protein